jgi:hypothetical protein
MQVGVISSAHNFLLYYFLLNARILILWDVSHVIVLYLQYDKVITVHLLFPFLQVSQHSAKLWLQQAIRSFLKSGENEAEKKIKTWMRDVRL